MCCVTSTVFALFRLFQRESSPRHRRAPACGMRFRIFTRAQKRSARAATCLRAPARARGSHAASVPSPRGLRRCSRRRRSRSAGGTVSSADGWQRLRRHGLAAANRADVVGSFGWRSDCAGKRPDGLQHELARSQSPQCAPCLRRRRTGRRALVRTDIGDLPAGGACQTLDRHPRPASGSPMRACQLRMTSLLPVFGPACHNLRQLAFPLQAQEPAAMAPRPQLGPMNNLDISRGQPRDTKIRLYGADAFEGMLKAGQLAAEALDMLVEHVKPGVTTERARRPRDRVCHRPWRHPRAAQLSRFSQGHLHLRQPRGLPRHPQLQAPEGWRYRQHRRDPDPRRLARRYQPHVCGGRISRGAPSG